MVLIVHECTANSFSLCHSTRRVRTAIRRHLMKAEIGGSRTLVCSKHTNANYRQALLPSKIPLPIVGVVVFAHQHAVFDLATISNKGVTPNHRAFDC